MTDLDRGEKVNTVPVKSDLLHFENNTWKEFLDRDSTSNENNRY